MVELLEKNRDIDGVIVANDVMACGAVKAIIQSGRKIPEDVQVIGFDNIEQGKYNTPAISTMSIDTQFIAALCIGLLENQLNGYKPEGDILVSTNLLLRETTRIL
jgi:DNA-binding LacI/PurR family transcriptional regulator